MNRLGFDDLGLAQDEQAVVGKAVSAGSGIVLFTGPVGSGKTNTLYAALDRVGERKVQIAGTERIQDLEIPGAVFHSAPEGGREAVFQSLAKEPAGVVVIDELKDTDDVRSAVRLVGAGHLVLSVVTGEDTAGVVARLVAMVDPKTGDPIDAKALGDALLLVTSQRLFRKVCQKCGKPAQGTGEFAGGKLMRGIGCAECKGEGYRGRTPAYELLPVTPAVREAMVKRESVEEIRELAVKEGQRPLRQGAVEKVKNGETTVEQFREAGFR